MSQGTLVFPSPRRLMGLCGGLAALGGVALLAGMLQAPERAWPNLLLASYYLLGLGLGGLVFVALQYVTGAGWGVPFRRAPEALAALVPVAALGLGLVFLARPSLYPRAHGAGTALHEAWAHRAFFLARAAVYLGAWLLLGLALVRTSRRQDVTRDPADTGKNVRLSAAFLVVFAVTFWLASHDWIESLEPEWSSTIFAVYQFGGLFLGGLAGIIVVVAALCWLGPFRQVVTRKHAHDLGKLLFGFSSFWMYLWFCQYMLIWYVNNPEETGYFTRRLEGAWRPLFFLNLVLNWAIPFVVLLPRATKERLGVLAAVSLVVLAGRWLDLYLAILPYSGQPTLAWAAWEVGLALGVAGLAGLVVLVALSRAGLVPVGDPYLGEGLPAHGGRPEAPVG